MSEEKKNSMQDFYINSNTDLGHKNQQSNLYSNSWDELPTSFLINRSEQPLFQNIQEDLPSNNIASSSIQENSSTPNYKQNQSPIRTSPFSPKRQNSYHQPFKPPNDYSSNNAKQSENNSKNQGIFSFKNKSFYNSSQGYENQAYEAIIEPVSLRQQIIFPPFLLNIENSLNEDQVESQQFSNLGDTFVKLKAIKHLDHIYIKNKLQSSGRILSYHIISYTTFLVQFATHTMAVHAMSRINDSTFMNKQDNPKQVKYKATLKTNEEINGLLRKRQQDLETIFSPPKCFCVHGLDPKIDNISHLMRPFNLEGPYEITENNGETTVYTYHLNAASVKDFLSAFQDNLSGVPNTYVTEEPNRRVIRTAIEIIKKRLVIQCIEDVKRILSEDVIIPAISKAMNESTGKKRLGQPIFDQKFAQMNHFNCTVCTQNQQESQFTFTASAPCLPVPSIINNNNNRNQNIGLQNRSHVQIQRSNSNPYEFARCQHSNFQNFGVNQMKTKSEPNFIQGNLYNQYRQQQQQQNQIQYQQQQLQQFTNLQQQQQQQLQSYQMQQQYQQMQNLQQIHFQQSFENQNWNENDCQVQQQMQQQYQQMVQPYQQQMQQYQQSQYAGYQNAYYSQMQQSQFVIPSYQGQAQQQQQQQQTQQQPQQPQPTTQKQQTQQKQHKEAKEKKKKQPKTQKTQKRGRKCKLKPQQQQLEMQDNYVNQKTEDEESIELIHIRTPNQNQKETVNHKENETEIGNENDVENDADQHHCSPDDSQISQSQHQPDSESSSCVNFYIGSRSNLIFYLSNRRSRFTQLVRNEVKRRKQMINSSSDVRMRERLVNQLIDKEYNFQFDSIKQPELSNNSSRLTPIHKIKEWHKRLYLRAYARMRRQKYILSRKMGLMLYKTQFSDNINDGGSNKKGVIGKRVYFEKSEIQGFGLFALEPISPKDFICEYTGQLIRMEVADRREKKLSKKGFQHMYLFRLGQMVIDATQHGSNARFLNHSCSPNCRARQITINEIQTISFFATKKIKPHEEVAFNYEMELETDPAKWEKCYCGSKECNGYLNYSFRRNALFRMWRETNFYDYNSDDSG